MARPLIVIPSQIGATRLPRKPLAEIAGEPMVVHVWRRTMEADAGDVVVATDSPEIAEAIESVGGKAVMTRADHPSGSDRVFEAANLADPAGKIGIIVNVQGDQPVLEPSLIRDCIAPLDDPAVDIATVAAVLTDPSAVTEPSVVKLSERRPKPAKFCALSISRVRLLHSAPARSMFISGSMPIAARRWRAS